MNNSPLKAALIRFLALLISVGAPLTAVLLYFPVWKRGGAASLVSGFMLFLFILVSVPLFKFMGERLRSAAAPIMWLFVFIVFFSLSRIADEMTVISLIGFISNLIAALLFRVAERYGGANGG